MPKPARPILKENGKRAEVKTTPSGLQYEVLVGGDGPTPKSTDRVEVHYTGKLIDGTVFDSSVDRGVPATFGVTQVIPGWVEALQLMKAGSKWRLHIPLSLPTAPAEPAASSALTPPSSLTWSLSRCSDRKTSLTQSNILNHTMKKS